VTGCTISWYSVTGLSDTNDTIETGGGVTMDGDYEGEFEEEYEDRPPVVGPDNGGSLTSPEAR
jgi:hypothetical protein